MNSVNGQLLQLGCGYLLNPTVVEKYKVGGDDYFRTLSFYEEYGKSYHQVQYDIQYLYGLLLIALRNGRNRFLVRYENSVKLRFNGLLLWHDLLNEYEYWGNKELYARRLETVISKPPKSTTTKALMAYLDRHEALAADLCHLLGESSPTDEALKYKLLRALWKGDSSYPPLVAGTLLDALNPSRDYQWVIQALRQNLLWADSTDATTVGE